MLCFNLEKIECVSLEHMAIIYANSFYTGVNIGPILMLENGNIDNKNKKDYFLKQFRLAIDNLNVT